VGDYRNGQRLLDSLRAGSGAFVVRPGPADEASVAVACVGAAIAGGRTAVAIVPDADPIPATAAAIADAFGDDAVLFLGGDKRARYRTWLDIAAGRFRVVVGTRPAVFAPLAELGLIYVHREGHAHHRDERSPSYHVRDVARMRADLEGAVSVLSAFCPSLEATVLDHVAVEPVGRPWAPVEVIKPGPEGRSPRLIRALRSAPRAFLFEPVRGYGVARVCRSCGEPAACASCFGLLRLERGSIRCVVCEAPGRCASCGRSDFGVVRRGAERVEEWARGVATVPVSLVGRDDPARPPHEREVLVGGVDALKDLGALGLDLVGILNADTSLRRPGVNAREHALVTWFEAAAWARQDGRVIVQTNAANDPAVQALVSGRPERFHRSEAPRRAEAGFPVGAPVFRVAGGPSLEREIEALVNRTLLSSVVGGATICLVVLDPEQVPVFGGAMRRLAAAGVVTRVEAEPHL
jgi:primosomal protein N' (replication factor Y)